VDARALLERARNAVALAREPLAATTQVAAATGRRATISDALATLRAAASPQAEYGRHALRLAATMALAAFLARALPLGRSYWVEMTAVLVLRPDFATTAVRGLGRIAGTLLGALVAAAIVALASPPPFADALLAMAFAALALALFVTNYTLFALAITNYVVFLLAFAGLGGETTIVERLLATLLGGALALAAYGLWPTWARAQVPERLAALLDAQRRYARLVLAAWADAAARDQQAIRAAQGASWRARTDADAAVDRMLAEPVRAGRVSRRVALGTLAASRRIGLAVLALDSRLPRLGTATVPALGPFGDALERELGALANSLRTGAAPAHSALVAAYDALVGATRDDPHASELGEEPRTIVAATGELAMLAGEAGAEAEIPI
ncbi:MAG: FUSC family protein, partial [Vulcanimicrobiaceae bacterium]